MSQNQQEQSEAKLLAFIEGELDAAGRAEIEKHLEAHPQHRKLLEQMRGMRDWVRWLPKETAPAELAEAFQMRLERTMLLDHVDEDAGHAPMRINRWPQLRAAAAVAALAVGLGAVVYYALPLRHNRFTAAPATRPSNTVVALESKSRSDALKLSDSMDLEKQVQTRELDGVDKVADSPTGNLKPSATPATAPADTETLLAKGQSAHERENYAAEGAGRGVAALGEARKKAAEPTEQLARIAQSTYNLVSDDPALIELLRNSKSHNAPLALRSADAPASFGAVAADAGRAEKAAELAPTAGSSQAGSTTSPQANSPQARSPQGLGQAHQGGHPFVMVVLAADTDRAHKQIGDYLAANGIETQSVNDVYSRRALNDTITARPQGNAAPTPPHAPQAAAAASGLAGSREGDAKQNAAPTPPHAATTVGPAAPAGVSAQPEAPAPAAAPVAAPAASPARGAVAAAKPRPQGVAQQPRFPAPPAAPPPATPTAAAPATPPAATLAPVLTAAPQSDERLTGTNGAAPDGAAALSEPDANGNIFIARRMTARQARELQATLRQPAQLQWAAVYREPADGSHPPQQLSEQLSDLRVTTPLTGSVPAPSPSRPPAVSLPAVSSSNPSNPSNTPAPGQAPSTQAAARADAFQQKDQVAFKYGAAAGEAPAARRSAAEAAEKDSARFAAKAPAPEQEVRARGGATTRPAERALAATTSPATPPPGAAVPGSVGGAGGAGGGGQDQLNRAMIRNKRDMPATAPVTQPNTSLLMEQAAGTAGDEQPVDVVIVLKQSPQIATTTQPAAK